MGKRKIDLPIKPMHIGGKIEKVRISDLKSGEIEEDAIIIKKAVVAYLDVLGFSKRKDEDDIKGTLFDFNGPLAVAAAKYPHINIHSFSDCAFVASDIKYAKDVLSALRQAFIEWTSDGILVRGGMSIGEFKEVHHISQQMSKNMKSNIFFGSGVNKARRLEEKKEASLLFVDKECAGFFKDKYNEPIFELNGNYIIAWPNDKKTMFWFFGISFLRLLKIISKKDMDFEDIEKKLFNNIIFALKASDEIFLRSLMIALLSSKDISIEIRKEAIKKFGIRDPEDFEAFEESTKTWKRKKELSFLKLIAYSDTGL